MASTWVGSFAAVIALAAAGCSSGGTVEKSSTRPTARAATETTARRSSPTTSEVQAGERRYSLGSAELGENVTQYTSFGVTDDLVVVSGASDAGPGSDGVNDASTRWLVFDLESGKQLGDVSYRSVATDSTPAAVAGRDANDDVVLVTRMTVRTPGQGIDPGRTDQFLVLFDVASGKERWRVDALLGDPPPSDLNSTSGTRPLTPVAIVGGNIVGYSASGIPADSPNQRIKAVDLDTGELVWQSDPGQVTYLDAVDDSVVFLTPIEPGRDEIGRIESRDAATGKVEATRSLPPLQHEAFFGGTATTYSVFENLVALGDGLLVANETIASLDAEGDVVTSPRVEAFDRSLTPIWSMDGVEIEDAPGGGVVVVSTDFSNGSGIGLRGVDARSGSSLWSIEPEQLEATDFSLSPWIDDRDDSPGTRALVLGTARDESGGGAADVAIDARTGRQVYVGSASNRLDTAGDWAHGVFFARIDDELVAFHSPEPPVGITNGTLVYPS